MVNTDELIEFSKVRFEKNKLTIDDSITEDEWILLGKNLKKINDGVQFYIGDWARFGEKRGFKGKYTDSKVYDELEEITGLSRKTIKEYKSVSERTSSVRADDLTFKHHREVASLPAESQKQLLTIASKEKLSTRQLRGMVKDLKTKSDLDKLAEAGELTMANLLTTNTQVMTKKEQVIQDWVDKNYRNADEIDLELIGKIIPILKAMKKKYGPVVVEHFRELSVLISPTDL